jgi:hypothetical protein
MITTPGMLKTRGATTFLEGMPKTSAVLLLERLL